MACFLVPATEAVVTTVVSKNLKTEDKNNSEQENVSVGEGRIPFSRKVKWLTNMLWGGSALLAFEHVWHGEVVPWFPFLTAAGSSEDLTEMLHEMSTVGVSMAVLITVVWFGMLAVSHSVENHIANEELAGKEENPA